MKRLEKIAAKRAEREKNYNTAGSMHLTTQEKNLLDEVKKLNYDLDELSDKGNNRNKGKLDNKENSPPTPPPRPAKKPHPTGAKPGQTDLV